MRKLRELTTYASLQEISASLAATVSDGSVLPEPRPEGEKEFVKLHKTARRKDPYGNKGSEAVKEAPYKKAPKNSGFPPEVKEEEEIDEAAGIARAMAKGANPLIKRPKFDARGNVILTKDAKKNIEYGKGPRFRKLTGQPYSTKKAFGEDKELDEGKESWFDKHAIGSAGFNRSKRNEAARQSEVDPIKTSGRRSKTRQARSKAGPNFPTVLVSPKGEKSGGKVTRIPKSQYDPKKHSLAEEQIDEKNWIAGAIKKPGALTAAAHRDKKSVGEFAQEHKHSSGKVGKRARLALTLGKLRKEELQIDELKKETLARYTKVAAAHAVGAAAGGNFKKAGQRIVGINRAQDRLTGTYETGKPLRTMIPGKGPNDKASGPYTMKRKKLYHGEETQLDEGGPTKKHFQMAADTIKAIPDEAKRKEHAHAHADLYTKQNPRFDRGKFLKAAGVNEEGLDEVITKNTPASDVIHDFVHSKNKVFKGDSKQQRIKRALGAYYGKQRGV